METKKSMLGGNLENYLRERDDVGKIIIHDLIGPTYNLLNLTREIRSSLTAQRHADTSSAEIAVAITERLLSTVMNLYSLSFDNKKLFVVSVFDVQEILEKVIKANENHFSRIQLTLLKEQFYMAGDAEVTRIWFDHILSLVCDRIGKDNTVNITLSEKHHDLVVVIHSEGNLYAAQDKEQFIDKVVAIDKLSSLLNASVAIDEGASSTTITLKISSHKTVSD